MVFVFHVPLKINCICIYLFIFLSSLLLSWVNLWLPVYIRMLAFLCCCFPCLPFSSFFLSIFPFFFSPQFVFPFPPFSLFCFSLLYFFHFSYFPIFHFLFLLIFFFFKMCSIFFSFPFFLFSKWCTAFEPLARWGPGNLLWRHRKVLLRPGVCVQRGWSLGPSSPCPMDGEREAEAAARALLVSRVPQGLQGGQLG